MNQKKANCSYQKISWQSKSEAVDGMPRAATEWSLFLLSRFVLQLPKATAWIWRDNLLCLVINFHCFMQVFWGISLILNVYWPISHTMWQCQSLLRVVQTDSPNSHHGVLEAVQKQREARFTLITHSFSSPFEASRQAWRNSQGMPCFSNSRFSFFEVSIDFKLHQGMV